MPIDVSDGFHHYGAPVRIETSDIVDTTKGRPVAVEVRLKAWLPPLATEPGPTKIGMDIDWGSGKDGTDLTPADAHRLAEVLTEFSDRVAVPAKS